MSPQDGIKISDWVKAELVDCTPPKKDENEKPKDTEQKPDEAESLSERPPTDEPE